MSLKDDRVTIKVGGTTVHVLEKYHVVNGVVEQPAQFGATLGTKAGMLPALKKAFAPGSKFELAINGVTQFRGRIDGFVSRSSDSGASIEFNGADGMADLLRATIMSEQSFDNITFLDLNKKCLNLVHPEGFQLAHDNEANRKAITNAPAQGSPPPDTTKNVDDQLTGADGIQPTTQQKTLQMKIGEKLWSFLKKENDQGCLFLYQSVDGPYILTTPNTTQPPLFAIKREVGGLPSRVISCEHTNQTAERYSAMFTHYRNGGGSQGRTQNFGKYVDKEMLQYGFNRPHAKKHDKCKSIAQAEHFAERFIAETRRKGFKLVYTVSGHTWPTLYGGIGVLAPDTVVDVDDEVEGLKDKFYLESVEHRSDPQAITVLHLMRLADAALLGGSSED